MKAGWKTVKLGEACKIVNGATPSTSVEANWGGPHCWITPAEMGGLSNPYVGETRRTLTDAGLADCSASLLPAGSVILSSRAPIGHVIINTVPMATNQGCKSMIPRGDLDAKFLFYFIKANVPLLESLGTGATFKELSGGKLASVEIPLPPLAEQKRIVALLDEAFSGIDAAKAKAEAKALQLESFIASAWSSLLPPILSKWPEAKSSPDPELPKGWSTKTIEEISEKDGPVRYGILQPGHHVENGVPYVRPTEIVKDQIPEGSLRRTSTKIASMYSRSVLKPNDVILTIVGTIGKVALVPKWLEGGNVTQSSARIRPESAQCSPDYLAAMLRSPILRRQFEHYRMGAAVTRLNIADVKTLRIPLPPLSMQSSIVKSLDSFKAHHAILTDNNDLIHRELATLKSAILAQAFAGELTA